MIKDTDSDKQRIDISIIILAAGQGTRMQSNISKLSHKLAGTEIINWLLNTLDKFNQKEDNYKTNLRINKTVIVLGYKAEEIQNVINKNRNKQIIQALNIEFALQSEQKGTGHAVKVAMEQLTEIDPNENILILNGDVPLINYQTINNLINLCNLTDNKNNFNLVTAQAKDPSGLGRIIRKKKTQNNTNNIIQIIEHKDASKKQLEIDEINAGIYCVTKKMLDKYILQLNNNNNQQEYYITDLIKLAVEDKQEIKSVLAEDLEIQGINTRVHLAKLERYVQAKIAKELMESGVTLIDPKRFDLRGDVIIGKDVIIEPNVLLDAGNGKIIIEGNVILESNVIIKNGNNNNNKINSCIIKSGVKVLSNTIIESSQIGKNSIIGPFARVRPNTVLLGNNKIGNFVELKNIIMGKNSKASHLSYLGDAEIGENVNIGAGVITCNYDGINKHQTIIKDNVFIGSDCQLIAPVIIGRDTIIAAGTTVMQNAPDKSLVLNKKEQVVKENYIRQ